MSNKDESLEKQKELTEIQKKKVLEIWQKSDPAPSIKQLTNAIFGGNLDGRARESQLIKAYLQSLGLEAPVSYVYQKKGLVDLTEEQKQFIANNIQTMNCLEISETLFNKKLTNLSQEVRSVASYARTLNDRVKYADPKDIATEKYKSPKIDSSMIARINKYVDTPIDEKQYDKNERQKRAVKAEIGYVNNYRFLQQINTYSTIEDRELFESTFITHTYGKDDLAPEEVSQYIMLANEGVIAKQISKRIEDFQRKADEIIDSSDEEKKHLSMSLVEIISSLRREYNDSIKRQQDLIRDLKGKRAERIKEKFKENESLLNLFEFWKNEDNRQQLIRLAELRKQKVKDEINRIESMDDLKIQVWGLDKNIIDGV